MTEYREFIEPYRQDLVNYFKAKKVGTTVHISGTTLQIHEDLVGRRLRRHHDRGAERGIRVRK